MKAFPFFEFIILKNCYCVDHLMHLAGDIIEKAGNWSVVWSEWKIREYIISF